MKYKTTIEIISEANDKHEAIEIVGEYLSGNIASGVEMKCATRAAHSYRNAVIAISISCIFLVSGILFLATSIKQAPNTAFNTPALSAIQPPLKTSCHNHQSREFKQNWQVKRNKEAISYIKK